MNVSPAVIAAAIVDAPAWALIGLTMPDEQMRERGAGELARWIAERINRHSACERQQIRPRS